MAIATSNQQDRDAQGAAERAHEMFALAVRQGRWPPTSGDEQQEGANAAPQTTAASAPPPPPPSSRSRPMLFEDAALAGAHQQERLRRKVAPRIANAASWRSLHARVLPRELAGLDERCTALLISKLARMARPEEELERLHYDAMVGAVAVATAPKLAGFADAALCNVMVGLADLGSPPCTDARFLRAWAEAAAEGERWAAGPEGAELLVAAGAAYAPALLAALLEEEHQQREEDAAAALSCAPAFARLFYERTAAAFAGGELEMRHVAATARAAEAFLRCGAPEPSQAWWRAVAGAAAAPAHSPPSPRGSRATGQFAAATAALGAAADAAAAGGAIEAAAREAAPLLEAELRSRAEEAASSSSSSLLSPAGAAAALCGLSSLWRAAAAAAPGDGQRRALSRETVAAVAELWRRRGFRARAPAATALCDALAEAARGTGGFVPDAEWRAAFELAVASRICPPGALDGGDEDQEGEEGSKPLPRRRPARRLRSSISRRDGAADTDDSASSSLALSSLALFAGWGHRPGPGWLAAFALSTCGAVARWPPRVLAAAISSLKRALEGSGSSGGQAAAVVSPLWALAALRALASAADGEQNAGTDDLAAALASLPPLLGLAPSDEDEAAPLSPTAALRALAPSRLSARDVAALEALAASARAADAQAATQVLRIIKG